MIINFILKSFINQDTKIQCPAFKILQINQHKKAHSISDGLNVVCILT